MRVEADKDMSFWLLDLLIGRWKKGMYPYNRKDAVVPQKLIPKEMRKDKRLHACFYFYVCIYMRGGIESSQAFLALIRTWRAHPDLFDPLLARWYSVEYVQSILKDFIGWDSETAAYNWVTNSRRLCESWDGNPLSLIKGVTTYEEACRRIRNKRTKTEIEAAGPDGLGFEGFQYKMVSMLLYFYDWEEWLKPRFLYPSPADFHNFRIAFSVRALIAYELVGDTFSIDEDVSYPWREVVMEYLRARKADPLVLSDAVWLFSLLLCGNSPYTVTAEVAETTLIEYAPGRTEPHPPLSFRRGKALAATCLVCPSSVNARWRYRHSRTTGKVSLFSVFDDPSKVTSTKSSFVSRRPLSPFRTISNSSRKRKTKCRGNPAAFLFIV